MSMQHTDVVKDEKHEGGSVTSGATRTSRTPLTQGGVLTLDGVSVTYPDGGSELHVLKDISFEPKRGELTAITGQSGSGKSTLLSCAAVLSKPTSGTVNVGGQDVWALSERDRRALRSSTIGIAFQQPNLFAPLTALEQLMMAVDVNERLARGKPKEQAVARARELLDLVGLEGLEGRRPHELSGGQRQRVNIARALINRPTLLLADEPTAALDGDRALEIVNLLSDVTRRLGVTSLMVTHSPALSELCDSRWDLAEGHLTKV